MARMGKAQISEKGIQDLTKLKSDLMLFAGDIADAGTALKSAVQNSSDELGIYADQILEYIDRINSIEASGNETIVLLTRKIDGIISDIEELIRYRL